MHYSERRRGYRALDQDLPADPSQPACGTVLTVCMMNIDLTGQAGVVTGAGRGIGLAVTRALTASGAHVTAGTPLSSAELDRPAAEGAVTTLEVAPRSGPPRLKARDTAV
jgi:hypothetical protein